MTWIKVFLIKSHLKAFSQLPYCHLPTTHILPRHPLTVTHLIPVRPHSIPFTDTYTESYLHSHICLHAQTLFLSNVCRNFLHSYLICARDVKDTRSSPVWPRRMGREESPMSLCQGKRCNLFQKKMRRD